MASIFDGGVATKTLALAALLATLCFPAPAAADCEVVDPTDSTQTCVDYWAYSYGDCHGYYGTDYRTVYLYSQAPGHVIVAAGVWEICEATPWEGSYEGHGAYATAYLYHTGTSASVGYYQFEGARELCKIYVQHNVGGWNYDAIAC